MRNLLDNLEEAGMNFDQVVSTNVYLDNLQEIPAFDEVYAQYFGPILPSRTTVQQIAPTDRKPDKEDHYPDLEQVSLIAIRSPAAHNGQLSPKSIADLWAQSHAQQPFCLKKTSERRTSILHQRLIQVIEMASNWASNTTLLTD